MHSHAVRAMLAAAESGAIEGLLQGAPNLVCAHADGSTVRTRSYVDEQGRQQTIKCCGQCLIASLKYSTSREYRLSQGA